MGWSWWMVCIGGAGGLVLGGLSGPGEWDGVCRW